MNQFKDLIAITILSGVILFGLSQSKSSSDWVNHYRIQSTCDVNLCGICPENQSDVIIYSNIPLMIGNVFFLTLSSETPTSKSNFTSKFELENYYSRSFRLHMLEKEYMILLNDDGLVFESVGNPSCKFKAIKNK